jgi:hypothetical protein
MRMQDIEFNKIYEFNVENVSYGDLTEEECINAHRDGRAASIFIEIHLTKWFPELTHITGNKPYDHQGANGLYYDAKNFTKGGLKFMPSNMIGSSRKLDKDKMIEKVTEYDLNYTLCDIVDFPKVRVKFINGIELLQMYEKASIPFKHRELIFG